MTLLSIWIRDRSASDPRRGGGGAFESAMRRSWMRLVEAWVDSGSKLRTHATRCMSTDAGKTSVRAHKAPRNTSIICTIGPASEQIDQLRSVVGAGMNVMRCNFSHGQFDEQGPRIQNLRAILKEINGEGNQPSPDLCGVAIDLKGPEIRTGLLQKSSKPKALLESGKPFTLFTEENMRTEGSVEGVWIDYPLQKNIVPGMPVYIDDGFIHLEVMECRPDRIQCRIVNGGRLGEKKGVNVPGTKVDLPAITEHDRSVLTWGAQQGADIVFASFIRTAKDVAELRDFLRSVSGGHMHIMSKIENQEGLDNFDSILEESDGIMIARGDLGIEIPTEEVPFAQKMMTERSNRMGKPVACATQMLESMEDRPRPSRAEAGDVVNAVLQGSDLVMLSGESANGKYPAITVQMMSQLCRRAELEQRNNPPSSVPTPSTLELLALRSLSSAAYAAAHSVPRNGLLILPADQVQFAQKVASFRPSCMVICPTTSMHNAKQLLLYRGVQPLYVPEPLLYEHGIRDSSSEYQKDVLLASLAKEYAIQHGWVHPSTEALAAVHNNDPRLHVPALTVL